MSLYISAFILFSAFATTNSGFFVAVILGGNERTMQKYLEGDRIDDDSDDDDDAFDSFSVESFGGEELDDLAGAEPKLERQTSARVMKNKQSSVWRVIKVVTSFIRRIVRPFRIFVHVIEFLVTFPIGETDTSVRNVAAAKFATISNAI
jgi:hypothetical protein